MWPWFWDALHIRLFTSCSHLIQYSEFCFLTFTNPHQIREINMYRGPSVTHYKFEFNPENLLRCWEECKLRSEYSVRLGAVNQFNQQNRWKKRGMSIIPIKYGIAFAEGFLNQVCGVLFSFKDRLVSNSHRNTVLSGSFCVCNRLQL